MNKLEALGCIEMTSQRQADNGTIRYFDPLTKAYYMLYENGYVRRSFGRYKMANGRWSDETIYQLNPKGKGTYTSPHSGITFPTTVRIMIETHDARMDCAARAVVNYRNTVKQQRLERLERHKAEQRRIARLVIDDCISMFFEGFVDFENTLNDIKGTLKEAKENDLA